MVGTWVLVAALVPWLAPHSPLDLDVMNRLEPPQWGHLFGTDEVGRDNFSRVLYGARITIPLAFTVIVIVRVADPAEFVAVSVYVVVTVGVTVVEPETGSDPMPLSIVTEVAFVVSQISVED